MGNTVACNRTVAAEPGERPHVRCGPRTRHTGAVTEPTADRHRELAAAVARRLGCGSAEANRVLDDVVARFALDLATIDGLRPSSWVGIGTGERWIRLGPPEQAAEVARERQLTALAGGLCGELLDVACTARWCALVYRRIRAVRPTGWADVAAACARLHAAHIRLDDGPIVAPVAARTMQDIARWSERGAGAGVITAAEQMALIERAAGAFTALGGPISSIHGDAHLGNVLVDPVAGPVLIDLETFGWGPCAYDAAVVDVEVRRFGHPATARAEHDAGWRDGGGAAVPSGHRLLAAVAYETWACAWAVDWACGHEAADAEARRRVASLVHGADLPWQRL